MAKNKIRKGMQQRFGAYGPAVESVSKKKPQAIVGGAGGWIVAPLTALAKGDRTVGLLTPGRVSVVDGPLHLSHKSANEIIEAARNAVQGTADKVISSGQMPAAPGDYTDDIQGRFFGCVLTVSDSPTEHSYGQFQFNFGFKRSTADAGVDDLSITVVSPDNTFSLILLATSDNGGIGSITEAQRINFECLNAVNPIRPQGTYFALEGLNLRDLAHVQR